MKRRVIIEKRVGETPLMALTKWKDENPEYKDVPASYAGRLDPMASGKLLILLGEECKKQKDYTKLDKEYDIEVLLDVWSDTGDALGLVEYSGKNTPVDNFSALNEIMRREVGSFVRPYPQYSSKTVNGKPLFVYALEGKIGEIAIPEHVEQIYKVKIQNVTSLSTNEIRMRLGEFLTRVPFSNEPSKALGADFRIDAVRQTWDAALSKAGARSFAVISLRVVCGSGTYMRSLAPRVGEALGTRAIAFSIKRGKIGRYFKVVHYMHAL